MLPAFRQQEIVKRLGRAGFVTVASLARDLAVDDSTIRRDLAELARDGLVRRVRGGAMPPSPSSPVDPSPGGPGAAPRLLASLTAADPAALGEAAERLLAAGVDGLHVDIADGSFVPYLTFGPRLVAAIRGRLPDALLDVHLMVEDPEPWIDDLAAARADRVTFHVESTRYPWRVVTLLRRAGVAVPGVALNPATPVETLDGIGGTISLVNVLSTEPDVAGEEFLAPALGRVRAIRERHGPGLAVVVDGGVTAGNLPSVCAAGASEVVVGRAITESEDWPAAVERLRGVMA